MIIRSAVIKENGKHETDHLLRTKQTNTLYALVNLQDRGVLLRAIAQVYAGQVVGQNYVESDIV